MSARFNDEDWRKECSRAANTVLRDRHRLKQTKDARPKRTREPDYFVIYRVPYRKQHERITSLDGVPIEEALDRARLDALAHPDVLEYRIRRKAP